MQISASAATRAAADRVGIELHELAEAARPGLLVAEHPARAIAAIGLRQPVVILGDIAGERRGQVVAQRQPLLVVVLEREHALVRPVLVGQELAERLGVFDERRLDRLEAVELVDARGSSPSSPRRRRCRPGRGRRSRAAARRGQGRRRFRSCSSISASAAPRASRVKVDADHGGARVRQPPMRMKQIRFSIMASPCRVRNSSAPKNQNITNYAS